ncbi:MAG: magnesium transporter [Alphaproteobacteria bacterium]|nr:magnesium transporter [Alphaproteobacteria bacterium]
MPRAGPPARRREAMTGRTDATLADGARRRASEVALYGLTPPIERAILAAVDAERPNQIRGLVRPLHPADVADLLSRLDPDRRRVVIEAIRGRFDPEILPYLDESVREDVFEALGTRDVAAALAELDSDDAVDLMTDLDEEERRRLLAAVPAAERVVLEQGLTYPESSAGRLMQREVVAVPSHWTVGQTIDFMRTQEELPEIFQELYVVSAGNHLDGVIPLSRLLRSKRPVRVADIMAGELHPVPPTTDQEEVAQMFRRYGLVSTPVVGDTGQLLGRITVDDVVDVIDEEAEEDLLKLGGVSESDITSSLLETARSRFVWLLVNLVTAFIAASVIGLFEDTIAQVVALAVLAPIVASMGGNAGTQSLTVAVRALAMREISRTNAMRVIVKEVALGVINGAIFGLVVGLVAWAWFGKPILGLVIGMALVLNLMAAGLAGMTIPLILERLGVDPAVASGVFLTTVTDVVGFFSFLGLATWLIL